MDQATNGTKPREALPAVTYGFIGIGVMGFGMAKNLRAKIPPLSKLVICEINKSRRDEFFATTQGILEVAETPKEVAEKADIIVTMLPQGKHVRTVFLDPSTGLLAIAKQGYHPKKFFLECSTIEASTSVEVGKEVAKSGVGDFLDSPVSGGPQGANAGALSFMCGAPPEIFARAKPILATMGKESSIFHCGKEGAGLATKQINNYVAYVGYLGLCEGMNTGLRYGLDPKVLAGVINVSSGMSWNSLHENPVKGVDPKASAAKDFEGGFTTELCHGVLHQAIDLSEEVGAKSLLGPVVQHVYDVAVESDKCRGKQSRSVYRLFAEDEGRELGTVRIE